MKPLNLVIEGINSFAERAEIDFESLISGRIFGIFGNTGSGKSTILDSIILALYGDMDRGKQLHFINSRKKKALVKFKFEMQEDGARKVYEIVREFKIAKNRDTKATLFEICKEGAYPLYEGVKNVNEAVFNIIGLDRKDFQKCIALPQGDFAAFVRSVRAERLNMIARLFSLDAFGEGIYGRAKERFDLFEKERLAAEGGLRAFEDITDEYISNLKQQRAGLSAKTEELTALKIRLEKERDLKLKSANAFEAYQREEEEYGKLLEQSADVEGKLRAVKLSEQAQRLSGLIEEEKKLRELLEELTNKDTDTAARLTESKERLNKIENILKNDEEKTLELRLNGAEALREDSDRLLSLKAVTNQLKESLLELENRKNSLLLELKQEKDKLSGLIQRQAELTVEDRTEYYLKALLSKGLDSEYREALEYFLEKSEVLEELCLSDSALITVKREVDGRIEHYNKKRAAVEESNVGDDVFKRLNEDRERRQESERLSALVTQREKAVLTLNAGLEKVEDEKNAVLNRIKDAKSETDRIKSKIDAVTDGEPYAAFLGKIKFKLAALQEYKAGLSKEKNSLLELIAKLNEERGKIAGLTEDAEKRQREQAVSAAELLKNSGFKDIDEAAASILSPEAIEKYQTRAEEFNTELNIKKDRLNRAKEQLTGERITLENAQKAAQDAENTANSLKCAGEELAVLDEKLSAALKSMSKKLEKEREYGIITDRLNTANRLKDLVANRSFLEFACDEYLKDISFEASGILEYLTNGRYELIYEGDFYAVDNLSGGEQRIASSLSGGETFLVSLSLAVALSGAIYSKSNKPIEFFFLDEGFGTLDEELLDTVLACLEKLKKDYSCIGLISHVQELKHRVQSKIIVTGATAEKGSSVELII